MSAERLALVVRAWKLRREIAQHFDDVAHWNTQVRQSGDAPIEPDPDGQLAALAGQLDRMLEGAQ